MEWYLMANAQIWTAEMEIFKSSFIFEQLHRGKWTFAQRQVVLQTYSLPMPKQAIKQIKINMMERKSNGLVCFTCLSIQPSIHFNADQYRNILFHYFLFYDIFFFFEADLCISFIHSDMHICTFPTQKGHWKHIVNTDESDLWLSKLEQFWHLFYYSFLCMKCIIHLVQQHTYGLYSPFLQRTFLSLNTIHSWREFLGVNIDK